MVTNADVLRYLRSMDFPAPKEDIVREAERAGAPPEVLRALRAMPPVEYGSTEEVARSAATDRAPEVTPADLAAKTRNRTHQRVARHLRQI
ncbi:DUF2795 domain-containing protein [Micromonospora sp. HM5-17]|jgi:hypothetical protein|uniref:DUF2795 domain-containing protein n=1 Tax=Micromonospora sp. HM5-17 TaxID=2487710 RepID=UPI000F475BB1|nr:DUF2795 domain-containing protein [Micromonospora sp. HM5-17]ROT29748.1 DUF2795 domain-containing protein [Micromonospora sp. HM5-17]